MFFTGLRGNRQGNPAEDRRHPCEGSAAFRGNILPDKNPDRSTHYTIDLTKRRGYRDGDRGRHLCDVPKRVANRHDP